MAAKRSKQKSTPRRAPIRVAIVGGGCAGVTAAWYLSKQGHHVEVFEKSWCLGGKGASGRDAQGHILEHGLHIWLGFYDNAFRMIRECYDEVRAARSAPTSVADDWVLPHASFEEAFFPEPHIGVAIPGAGDEWNVWSGLLPLTEGLPGDPLDEETNPFTLANYLQRCLALLKALMQSVIASGATPAPGQPRPGERSPLDESIEADFSFDPMRTPAAFVEVIARYLRTGALTTAAGLLQAVTILEHWIQRINYTGQAGESALNLLEAIAAQTRKQLRDVVSIDPKLRWKTEVIDIVMTIAVGLYRDRVLFSEEGLDAVNHKDYKEWLREHGATDSALDSQFLNGIYDLTFAYRDGDHRKPALAAGVALRGALRMFFTYRGSMFWRMRSGMGDAVFAPLYRVLQARGVKFSFLHELDHVLFKRGEDGQRYVDTLAFRTAGDKRKNILDKFGCWSRPADGASSAAASKKAAHDKREAGKDFDAVIFAMGIDDFRKVLSSGESGDPHRKVGFLQDMPQHWQDMWRYVGTVATQSLQVWMKSDLEELGWKRGSGIITGLKPPFATWADMTHTLGSERAWRARHGVALAESGDARSVAYFCGVLPEAQLTAEGRALERTALEVNVAKQVQTLLRRTMKPLWPAAFQGVRSARGLALKRHVQVNFEDSERYTLSLPGTIQYRISPLDASVANMAIAGDWTACGLDAGCVEGAVMSGMLAAHAITNDEPRPESIIGYDHP